MTDQNIAIVQSLYAAFGAGDVKSIIKACSADIVWEVVGRPQDFPLFGPHHGLEGVASFFQALVDQETFTAFEPLAFHASGDKVIVEGHFGSTLNHQVRTIDSDWLQIFTFRSGQLVRFKEFYDTAQYVA